VKKLSSVKCRSKKQQDPEVCVLKKKYILMGGKHVAGSTIISALKTSVMSFVKLKIAVHLSEVRKKREKASTLLSFTAGKNS
jgi:hypothetical protein